ncbi:RNAse [Arthrobacter phage Edmundo]|nr:RNAse [Arthrobacter phage Edmundo]
MITDIYTDASIATKGHTAGHGWVIVHDIPRYHVTVGFSHKDHLKGLFNSVVYAELKAMEKGIKAAVATKDDMFGAILWSDSEDALGMVESPVYHPDLQKAYSPVLNYIRREARANRLKLSWVKGHGDDPYNDAADRLAVLARRNREYGLPRDHSHTMAARVAQELIDWHTRSTHQGNPDNIALHRAMKEPLCRACRRALHSMQAEMAGR